ncbi:hypothetical protein C6N75_08630 [Streptomyces solincola]|uniref:Integral membrane protein n=1 Tax=Streptomyces solincola TaxID=2100817 RepID=A0A2S9PZ52_9ACTN|nr:hypothetical protein [Streptomyces solincola]PRH79637.1 hypothetical protein C6N75_08630 [Streptomyces solincola]
MAARRAIALAAGIVLLLEAVGTVLLHLVLAVVMGGQRMSLDGLDPDHMVTGIRVLGFVFGAFLALCGVLLLVVAVRNRPPTRPVRILLIACAVVHGLLGAVCVGLVGWAAFTVMMAVLALLVAALVLYAPDLTDRRPAPA